MKFNTKFDDVSYTLNGLWNNIKEIEDEGLKDALMSDYNDLENSIDDIENSIRDISESINGLI